MDEVKTLVRCDEDGIPCIVQAIRPENLSSGWVRFYDGVTLPYRCHESQQTKGSLHRLEAMLGRVYEEERQLRKKPEKIVIPHILS